MLDPVLAPLSSWQNFYVITGSVGGSLTGLMFVSITLIANLPRRPNVSAPIRAFSTPTVVHFCGVLLLSGILCAPWHTIGTLASALSLLAVLGVAYVLRAAYHMRRQTAYAPVMEDWLFYAVLPTLAYAIVLAGGIALPAAPVRALFVIAAGALSLLFIGIHNAWDQVLYISLEQIPRMREEAAVESRQAPVEGRESISDS